jgi:hypothetical protein
MQSGLSLIDAVKENKIDKNNGKYNNKMYGLGSLGVGVAYYVNPFAQI